MAINVYHTLTWTRITSATTIVNDSTLAWIHNRPAVDTFDSHVRHVCMCEWALW